jgi:hypothetical protein
MTNPFAPVRTHSSCICSYGIVLPLELEHRNLRLARDSIKAALTKHYLDRMLTPRVFGGSVFLGWGIESLDSKLERIGFPRNAK